MSIFGQIKRTLHYTMENRGKRIFFSTLDGGIYTYDYAIYSFADEKFLGSTYAVTRADQVDYLIESITLKQNAGIQLVDSAVFLTLSKYISPTSPTEMVWYEQRPVWIRGQKPTGIVMLSEDELEPLFNRYFFDHLFGKG